MRNAYTIDFVSHKGRLQARFYFDNKVQKQKTFPIFCTLQELKNPSVELERMILSIRTEFNKINMECYGTGKNPIRKMFPNRENEIKRPYDYFKSLHDGRLSRWLRFIDTNVSWEDIDSDMLIDYVSYLEGEDLAPGTMKSYMSLLSSIISDAIYKGYSISSKNYKSILSAPTSETISIYLNMDDIRKLEMVELNDKWDAVRKRFLIGVYTGARYSDLYKLREANIESGEVQFISKKTGQRSFVPLHPKLISVLSAINGDTSNVHMNRILPKIGELAGINEEVSVFRAGKQITGKKFQFIKSHCGRRSFATNVYLSGEYDIRTISKFLGHKSITTTEKYIACGVFRKNKQDWSYFN